MCPWAHVARTQIEEGLHVVLEQLDAADRVVDDALPFFQLQAGIRAVGEEQRVVRVLLDGLRIEQLGLVVVSVLEALIARSLQLLGRIFVTRRRHVAGRRRVLGRQRCRCRGSALIGRVGDWGMWGADAVMVHGGSGSFERDAELS